MKIIPIKLTPKQEKYCQEYIKTGSKSKAYRLAYNAENMKPETINVKAVQTYNQDKIRLRIEELQERTEKRNDITIDWVISKLKKVAEENDKDRVPALDKLMKHLGGYERDNNQQSNNIILVKLPDNGRNNNN
jgi:phage terminase small subunit